MLPIFALIWPTVYVIGWLLWHSYHVFIFIITPEEGPVPVVIFPHLFLNYEATGVIVLGICLVMAWMVYCPRFWEEYHEECF